MKPSILRFSIILFFSCLLLSVSTLFTSCDKKWAAPSYNEGFKPMPNGPWLPAGNVTLATVGRVLFYDKNLSLDKSVSCSSCHQQAYGFADNKAFSTGYNGLQTPRNAHSIINSNNEHFWDGRVHDYQNAISIPLETHSELNMLNMDTLCNRLQAIYYYPILFAQTNPHSTNTITKENIVLALSAFITSIDAANSRYDQAYPSAQSGKSPTATFTQQEINGMNIFNGKGKCNLCHNPSNNFGGNKNQFEDVGLDMTYTDLGRGGITFNQADNGRFQVPALKNVALTAPYMHDGRFKTLAEVVDFFSDNVNSSPNLSSALTAHPSMSPNGSYTTGGTAATMGLTADEKSDLIAFLQTLTDMSQINDINFSDPFKH